MIVLGTGQHTLRKSKGVNYVLQSIQGWNAWSVRKLSVSL